MHSYWKSTLPPEILFKSSEPDNSWDDSFDLKNLCSRFRLSFSFCLSIFRLRLFRFHLVFECNFWVIQSRTKRLQTVSTIWLSNTLSHFGKIYVIWKINPLLVIRTMGMFVMNNWWKLKVRQPYGPDRHLITRHHTKDRKRTRMSKQPVFFDFKLEKKQQENEKPIRTDSTTHAMFQNIIILILLDSFFASIYLFCRRNGILICLM